MAIKLVLSAEQIGNKVFKGVPRGYDPYEVDKFLDQIILDYERVENNYLGTQTEIDAMKRRIAELEKEKANLEIEVGKYKTKYSKIKPTDNVTDDNINLIKRINTLETFLWQNGFNPHNIK
ncbi:MAG: DivIVA domain-containing protein [Bacilli bacterium]|nr:DivIVA domain-containing protein [Bacilli bacterium]